MFRIVALDSAIADGGDLTWESFEKLGDFKAYPYTSPDEIAARAADADAVIINKVVLDKNILSQLPHLKYIGVIATGYDNVDVAAAREFGITVTNVPDYSSDSVAQTVFALLLEITNHITRYDHEVKAGKWVAIPFVEAVSDHSLRITELAGKTMAVLGLGNIGRKVAEIAHAFGMEVISPTGRKDSMLPAWIRMVSMEEMFTQADVLSINSALTPERYHIVNSGTLSMMKRSAIVINTARGGFIDSEALDNALISGTIAAAGLDVLEKEPPEYTLPLLSNPKCVITPHIAWDSLEARARLMKICADNLKAYMAGNPTNTVTSKLN